MPGSRKFVQSLVDAHPEPFALIDRDYTIVACNQHYAEAYTRLVPADIVGMKCHEVSHKSASTCEINGEECPLHRVFETEHAVQVIHRHMDRDHKPEYVAVHGSPVYDDHGRILYMGEGMRSITQEQELAFDEQKMVGCCPSFMRVIDNLCLVAESDSPALIHGETGTGKEMAAQLLHRKSPRAKGPFITVDSTSFTEDLLVNELFGHEPGAFTGCIGAKKGLVELADQGTLFMDEIGEIPLSLQAKLLRVLETGTFRRLGGTEERRVDFRFICATHRDLRAMVERGDFRADLYYRINVMQIELPPLRHRKDDIPHLVAHFLSRRMLGKLTTPISEEAMALLYRYPFPGNMRELKNIVERAALLARGGAIQPEHLPEEIRRAEAIEQKLRTADLDALGHHCHHDDDIAPATLRATLARFNGNRRKTAAFLKMSERTLYRRLKSLDAPSPEG
ncbi:MAG: Fis family transcriptional regulator [Hydrogenophilales bacterium 16-64-46]|nr:MAG: Fis family transcriptional regulator [Hydrogenophilales bacterium 12-64-13]OYZ06583.1 MAG: Fis family transcriptional regulator [Hydrogenophilales bacterium 16-64-46]OZA39291.1 MAG: Fis family transcriptional regulator [Hydrogenophilales bacterium 17-64-34]HQS98847.1 sigma 54-interacting transcriptional regulator [Thiobacillus sp.]